MATIKRVIIETQSNRLFVGSRAEQAYDQRGGLCEVGAGHVVVTTEPYDPDYLDYWKRAGFSLPTLIAAGPFDPACVITDLIARNPVTQSEILQSVNGSPARIEPFWVEKGDLALSETLGIPTYSNIAVCAELACRFSFKQMCERLELPTAPWVGGHTVEEIIDKCRWFSFSAEPVLAKAANCTGGIELGTMLRFSNFADMSAHEETLRGLQFPLVIEHILPDVSEVGVHWEISETGEAHFIGIFDQLSRNFSYAGAAFPSIISDMARDRILEDLRERFMPELVRRQAKGFFCCDVLINSSEDIFWTDFNPRKGAILYIFHMVERLAREVFGLDSSPWQVSHAHTRLPKMGLGFAQVQEVLAPLLNPSKSEPFIVLTNPGPIPFGGIDITGLSPSSREEASDLVTRAEGLLQSALS